MNSRVWRAKCDVLRKKTSQIAKVQKKLRISVAISQFFVIEQSGLRKKKLRISFFSSD